MVLTQFSSENRALYSWVGRCTELEVTASLIGRTYLLGCFTVRRTFSDIANPKARHEAQSLVEGMHPWVGSPALHEHMMTIARPRMRERGLNDGAAVPAPA